MRRGEKRSSPPELAGKILSVVDLLPPGLNLRDVNTLYGEVAKEEPVGIVTESRTMETEREKDEAQLLFEIKFYSTWGSYWLPALEQCLAGLPAEFVEYVNVPRSEPDPESVYREFTAAGHAGSYDLFLELVERHPGFLNYIRMRPGGSVTSAKQRYIDARSWYIRLYLLGNFLEEHRTEGKGHLAFFERASNPFRVDNLGVVNGRLAIEPDVFTLAFVGVPVDRIRLCRNCGRVFWAKRIEMKGCSKSCAKILRTRKWREKITPEQKKKYYIDRTHREWKKGEN